MSVDLTGFNLVKPDGTTIPITINDTNMDEYVGAAIAAAEAKLSTDINNLEEKTENSIDDINNNIDNINNNIGDIKIKDLQDKDKELENDISSLSNRITTLESNDTTIQNNINNNWAKTKRLVAGGTKINAEGVTTADLNSTDYLKVGEYYCSLNAFAKNISNSPTDNAFKLIVENMFGKDLDLSNASNFYLLQTLITYMGDIFVRGVYKDSAAANINRTSWKKITTTNVEATAQ